MSGKPGTLLGRALTALIPAASPLHAVAVAADQTFEHLVFDQAKDAEVPLKEHTDVTSFVDGTKNLLLALAEKGIIAFNFPLVEGENEAKVEHGIVEVLEGYVNEVTD
jgi:hypothetical protein